MRPQIRKLTFGKYKGQPILLIIAKHIGYIMWCLENLQWFHLNEDEQKFYDWQAIAIKKYGKQMIFPVEKMYKYIHDKDTLCRLATPYQFIGDNPYIPETDITPLLREAGVLLESNEKLLPNSFSSGCPWWSGLHHSAMKEIDCMSEEEIQEMEDYGVTPPLPPMY